MWQIQEKRKENDLRLECILCQPFITHIEGDVDVTRSGSAGLVVKLMLYVGMYNSIIVIVCTAPCRASKASLMTSNFAQHEIQNHASDAVFLSYCSRVDVKST